MVQGYLEGQGVLGSRLIRGKIGVTMWLRGVEVHVRSPFKRR